MCDSHTVLYIHMYLHIYPHTRNRIANLSEERSKVLAEYEEDLIEPEMEGAGGEVLRGREGRQRPHESDDLICREMTFWL